MELVITVKQQVLGGELSEKARAAALGFFQAIGVTPEQAARSAWQMEGVLEFNAGDPDAVTEEACRQADAWAEVTHVVAEALGVSADEVDVEVLQVW